MINIVLSVSLDQSDDFRKFLSVFDDITIREESIAAYAYYRRFFLVMPQYFDWKAVLSKAQDKGFIVMRMESLEDKE
jgi:hypothetical protein